MAAVANRIGREDASEAALDAQRVHVRFVVRSGPMRSESIPALSALTATAIHANAGAGRKTGFSAMIGASPSSVVRCM
jgi:hypothetical protein